MPIRIGNGDVSRNVTLIEKHRTDVALGHAYQLAEKMKQKTHFILVPLSAAEFLDRYLIYELKSRRARRGRRSVNSWLKEVDGSYQRLLRENPSLLPVLDRLRTLHAELWSLEIEVRATKAAQGTFGTLAKKIIARNNERHRIKDIINETCMGTNPDLRHYGRKRCEY